MRIAHVVNSFDPSASAVRCVAELEKHSRHEHRLVVRERHPFHRTFQFVEAALCAERIRREDVESLFGWADAILYQFVGFEDGFSHLDFPYSRKKPCAFRNINIYWDAKTDRFYCAPYYNAKSLDAYRLVASSHVGATDFLGADKFRWLPDLIPIFDAAYTPDFTAKPPCVSFIKHAEVLAKADFGPGVAKMNLHNRPHAEVLARRKAEATVAIDNVCDGHLGLSGNEMMALGIPFAVFNHACTENALLDLADGERAPLLRVGPSVALAIDAVRGHLARSDSEQLEWRRALRAWTEKYMSPARLIARFWDPALDALSQ